MLINQFKKIINKPDKLRRLLAVTGSFSKSRCFTGPISVALRINLQCNFNCVMCGSYSPLLDKEICKSTEPEMTLMSLERVRELAKEFRSLHVCRVQVGGKGEPFMHPMVIDIMQEVKGGGCYGFCFTNGSLITKEKATALVKMQWDEINFSINAAEPDTHRAVSQTNAFSKIMTNLVRLQDIKRSMSRKKPVINISNVIFNVNYQELTKMYQLAEEVKADSVSFFLASLGKGYESLRLSRKELEHLHTQCRGLIGTEHKTSSLKSNIHDFLNSIDERLRQREGCNPIQVKIPCYIGWFFLIIEPKGTVFPCCHCNQPLGNIASQELSNIWRSNTYKEFRRKALSLPQNRSVLPKCNCEECTHIGTNIFVHKLLHPLSCKKF